MVISMEEKRKVPRIRFKGYTDDWEQRKLEEFGVSTGGTSIESEFSENGKYKVISIGSYSDTSVYNDQGIRANISDKTKSRLLNKDDLTMILNDKTASGRIIGRVLYIEKSEEYVYNQRTERIEINKEKYNSRFIYQLLNAPEMRKKIIKQSQGNTQIFVNWTSIKNTEYLIPKKDEQIKMAKILDNIDNLITLHQRKCDKLVAMKKSLLEKMFPKNSSKVPEIRFKGYTDDWEQRKLGELVIDTIDNRGKNPPYYCESGIPIIDNFMIKNNGYPNLKIATRYLDNYLFNNFIRKYNEIDDVLITLVGNGIGNIALFPKEKSAIIQNTIGLRFNDNKKFMYYSLLSKNNEIIKLDRGMAQPSIRQDELKGIEINLPNIIEKNKIANLMTNIDNLITLHQRKLEKLKNIKKSMLEKMFI